MALASPPSCMCRRSRAAAHRNARDAAHRVTLEQLVDAGEAMLLEMMKLTRQAESGKVDANHCFVSWA